MILDSWWVALHARHSSGRGGALTRITLSLPLHCQLLAACITIQFSFLSTGFSACLSAFLFVWRPGLGLPCPCWRRLSFRRLLGCLLPLLCRCLLRGGRASFGTKVKPVDVAIRGSSRFGDLQSAQVCCRFPAGFADQEKASSYSKTTSAIN